MNAFDNAVILAFVLQTISSTTAQTPCFLLFHKHVVHIHEINEHQYLQTPECLQYGLL